MKHSRWILIDTETTGLSAPIFVVEIGAQLMEGWSPVGPPFRRLINQNAVIPPEASRVHGYTKEILERDGESAVAVYSAFAKYVQGLPIVAFNLAYDLDQVLLPEWERLGIATIGKPGFCALQLAQRLLDPVPAGNCKLQTLRQYYRLPERGAHTALGDVETVVDLLALVLAPLAERLGLDTWDKVSDYAAEQWFPSRIAFGKFKGRLYQEARTDIELLRWFEWLAASTSARSAAMGRWYLERVKAPATPSQNRTGQSVAAEPHAAPATGQSASVSSSHVVVYSNPALAELKAFVAAARARLGDLEAQYTAERHAVDVTQGLLFGLLRGHYQRRDRIKLVVSYRQKYLDVLLRAGEEEAEQVAQEYQQAKGQSDTEYEQAAKDASGRKELSEAETQELKAIWKKLVKTYHPDRFANDPEKLASFTQLTSVINQARDNGDIERLREIANDPHGFMMRHGLGSLNFDDSAELASLQKLLDTLQIRIVETIEAFSLLKEDPQYELHVLSTKRAGYLEELAKEHAAAIDLEIEQLKTQADALETEINELTGTPGTVV
jgi:DNA polymerase III epsilon subunit-like protein